MVGSNVSTRITNWLDESGLTMEDMQVRPSDMTTHNALQLPANLAYNDVAILPYRNIDGYPINYYRARVCLEDFDGYRYRQARHSTNHIYFPVGFKKCLRALLKNGTPHYVIFTEGEKKAALANKRGFPTVGLGGVDNFVNKKEASPKESTEISQTRKDVVVSRSGNEPPKDVSTLAIGFKELKDLIKELQLYALIIYDTDEFGRVKIPVQEAATRLGFKLHELGIEYDKIRQITLPSNGEMKKVGLDDFLVARGDLQELIDGIVAAKVGFPRHPNIKEFITKASYHSPSGEEAMKQALMMFTELEYRGQRCQVSLHQQFYQIKDKGIVIPADFPTQGRGGVQYDDSIMYGFMWREMGLTGMQHKSLELLKTMFSHNLVGIDHVAPERVVTTATIDGDDRCVASQIGDNSMIVTTSKETKIELNCTNSIMFLSGATKPILKDKFEERLKIEEENFSHKAPDGYWWNVASQSNIIGVEAKQLFALTMYVWPWLRGWRDFQMPILVLQGEQNSGKTSIAELIQIITTGKTDLKSKPKDIRELSTVAANAGGALFFDNIGYDRDNMTKQFQDHLSTLVTMSDPKITTYKMYRDLTTYEADVHCCFGFTSIELPFRKLDFLSRSMIFDFQGSAKTQDHWTRDQLELYGGREGWLAHHHTFLRRFFEEIDKHPQSDTMYRMKGFQTVLEVTAKVFGQSWEWIGKYLQSRTDGSMRRADQVIEGLLDFRGYWGVNRWRVANATEYFQGHESFGNNSVLTNSQKLGFYLRTNTQVLRRQVGIILAPTKDHNAAQYDFIPIEDVVE